MLRPMSLSRYPSPFSDRELTFDTLYPSYIAKFQAADILNVISAILCFVLLITYLVLPTSSQANYPKVCLAISLFMLNGAVFFTLTPSVRNLTLCNDAISSANYTNWRCMWQAFFVVVGAHGAALWVSVRVYTGKREGVGNCLSRRICLHGVCHLCLDSLPLRVNKLVSCTDD